ncbi:sugar ABC transporter substrate-binding protein [Amycolatopsis viridis]|uniref:Ribose transport system substrate-binding protein n=1 Tax=Amycolatopsis viridis TaxID=185678 RepID=A0ABX0SRB9_9PSEU|nr:sugar ABC transporter substrate-binding protein [Amycolatopsis viridis]NIH78472.1 ribose transport system substrate-binding protein [Amycolatopsis viridis]
MRRHHRARLLWPLLTAVLATACGTVSTAGNTADTVRSDDPRVAEARRTVAEAMNVPEFTLDAPVIDAAKARGKRIAHIPGTSQLAYQQNITAALKKTAARLGIEFIDFSVNGTPADWAKALDTAITQRPDVILVDSPDPGLLVPQLTRAKAAGIQVVSGLLYQSQDTVPENVRGLLSAVVTKPFRQAGALQATYAFSQLGDKLKPLVLSTPDFLGSRFGEQGITESLGQLCPGGCRPTFIRLPSTQWDKFRTEVQSALNRDPSLNYILPLYDNMALPVVSGLLAQGRTGTTPIATYNGTPAALDLVRSGGIGMDIGESLDWYAMAMFDQCLRLLVGAQPVASGDERTPLRIFTKDNVAETGVPATPANGYGTGYLDGYAKLWSVPAEALR